MRAVGTSKSIHEYVLGHANPPDDEVAEWLHATSRERFGRAAGMNVGVDQGRFLQTIVAIARAETVVEVGTFTGMSALWLARGLPDGGRLICFDLVDTYAEVAREAWDKAGVADRIDLRFGPAADGLAALPEERHIDVAFIDADKTGYRTYLDLLLPRMAPTGVILVDNVLWNGRIIDESDDSADTVALRAFNDHVVERTDCEAVMLTIGDGVTMIRPV